MFKKYLEHVVLRKLNKGLLDGVVGKDLECGNYAKVTIRHVIENGVPKQLRISPDKKYFDNRENIRVPGKIAKTIFESKQEKLGFLQKYGWLMDDKDVKKYSALFKPKK